MQVYKFLSILCFSLGSLTTVSSQENKESEQSILAGFGPSLELNNALTGINGRVYYGVNESLCFGPEVSYFPYQNTEEGYEKSIIDLNVNAHYIIELNENIGLYPLTGINYTIEKERLIHENDKYEEENELGLNYGVGIHYKLKNTFIFTEFKGVTGRLPAEFITVGVIFNFQIKK